MVTMRTLVVTMTTHHVTLFCYWLHVCCKAVSSHLLSCPLIVLRFFSDCSPIFFRFAMCSFSGFVSHCERMFQRFSYRINLQLISRDKLKILSWQPFGIVRAISTFSAVQRWVGRNGPITARRSPARPISAWNGRHLTPDFPSTFKI